MTTTQQLRARGLAHLGLWSAYPGRTHPGRLRWVPAVVGLALVLVAWFAVTATGAVDPLYLPGPLDVAARMADLDTQLERLVEALEKQLLQPRKV